MADNNDQATEFATLLLTHAKGRAHDEATKKLREAVEAVQQTGKAASVTVKLDIKPVEKIPNAFRIQRTGRHKLAIATLFERARWEIALATTDPEFKLNNNFRAYYARLLMENEDDLAGLFELRASEADAWVANYRVAS